MLHMVVRAGCSLAGSPGIPLRSTRIAPPPPPTPTLTPGSQTLQLVLALDVPNRASGYTPCTEPGDLCRVRAPRSSGSASAPRGGAREGRVANDPGASARPCNFVHGAQQLEQEAAHYFITIIRFIQAMRSGNDNDPRALREIGGAVPWVTFRAKPLVRAKPLNACGALRKNPILI